MEDINKVISRNLKAVREERKISLDGLAKLTGVSKSMLGQIERSEANPSISTIWKISDGLKISFADLTDMQENKFSCKDINEIEPLYECKKKFRNYPLYTFYNAKRAEIYYIEIDEGAMLKSDSHGTGATEYITVFKGAVTITLKDSTFVLSTGMSLQFSADETHSYLNSGNKVCRLHMVISYS